MLSLKNPPSYPRIGRTSLKTFVASVKNGAVHSAHDAPLSFMRYGRARSVKQFGALALHSVVFLNGFDIDSEAFRFPQ